MRAWIVAVSISGLIAAPPTSAADETHQEAAAQKVHIDPKTGEFVSAPVIASIAPEDMVHSTSDAGLYEQLSPVFRGGVLVHLQGRFQSTLRATLDREGKLTFTHERLANPD